MSRAWVDMDSPPPRSPLSPPIPYRQPSYSELRRNGSLSPPNGFPFKPSAAAPSPPPAAVAEEEEGGGWGVDADPVGHSKRMKKYKERSWGTGQPASAGISQTFNSQPRQYQPPPPQQQQQQQQRFQPPPPPPQAAAPPSAPVEPFRQEQQRRPEPAPGANSSADPGSQDARSTTPVQPSSPSVSTRSNNSGRKVNLAGINRVREFLDQPQKPPIPRETPPVPPANDAAAPQVPLGREYTGRIDAHMMPHQQFNDPNRAVLTAPRQWGRPSAGPTESVPIRAEPVQQASRVEVGKEEVVSDGGWGEDAPKPTRKKEVEAPAPVVEAAKEPSDGGWGEDAAKPSVETAAPAPKAEKEAAVQVPAAEENREPSDGGWGEDAPKQSPPAPAPAIVEKEVPAPAVEEKKEASDGGWGEDAPAPTLTEEKKATPAPAAPAPPAPEAKKDPSDGGWGTNAPAPVPAEDVGPDGGWVQNPRVRSWVRSTTPVAEPPQDPTPVLSPSDPAAHPIDSFTQALAVDAEAHAALSNPSASVEGQGDAGSGGDSYRNDLPRIRSEFKWRRDPHPAFDPRYYNSRLLVKFSFPIRTEAVKPTMFDHFSKYGHIRITWNHEQRAPESVDQVILVFDKEESLEKCLADPKHTTAHVKSGARSDIVSIKIEVTRALPFVTAKAVFVKVIGQRTGAADDASADPSTPRLPPVVHFDACPTMKRALNKVEWWARIRPPGMIFDDVNARALSDTGLRAEHITDVDLGPDVPEREFIPQLVEHFGDLVGIVHHNVGTGGWLVIMSSPAAGRSLMTELYKVPGIMSRWASPLEELKARQSFEAGLHGQPAEPERPVQAPSSPAQPVPVTREVKQTAQPVQPAPSAVPAQSSGNPNWTHSPTVSPIKTRQSSIPIPAQPRPAVPHHIEVPAPSVPATKTSLSATSSSATASIPIPRSSQLTKRLVPTCKGRTLREDTSSDTPKFYDDAAVFVSGLVKASETESSVFQRFSRYGQVCGVTYRPETSQGDHASAKVLFNSKAAADRALKYEHGSVSFGSTLKVEKRRVLQSDVKLEEKLVDDSGRAYSPDLAGQYSPPQLPVADDGTQPPPLGSLAAAGRPMFWMPFPTASSFASASAGQPIPYVLCAYYPPPGHAGAPPAPDAPCATAETPPPADLPPSAPTPSAPSSATAQAPEPRSAATSPVTATGPSVSPTQHQRTLLSQLNGANGHAISLSTSPSAPRHHIPTADDSFAEEAPELFDHQPVSNADIHFNPPANDLRTAGSSLPPTIVQARPFVPSYQYQQYQQYPEPMDGNSGVYYRNENGDAREFGYQPYHDPGQQMEGGWRQPSYGRGEERRVSNGHGQGRGMGYGGQEGVQHDGWGGRGGRGGRGGGMGRY